LSFTIIDCSEVRKESLAVAKRLGYSVEEALPLLDASAVARTDDEVVDRLLAMLCVAACAYGFDSQKAANWLGREVKVELLTVAERHFLQTKAGDRRTFMMQIEGMWALAWSIRSVPTLDFGTPCPQDFVTRLPDLKRNGSSGTFRDTANVRPLSEIVSACDLAYCLHWAIRDAQLRNAKLPGNVEEYVVVERRRALEWLLTDEPWEDITLDS
jgi:hypothetical protein